MPITLKLRSWWERLQQRLGWSPTYPRAAIELNEGAPFEIDIENQANGLSDGSDGRFSLFPAQYRSDLWRLAWTDGRIEHPIDERLDALSYQAKLELEKIIRDQRREIANFGARARMWQERSEGAKIKVRDQNAKLEVLRARQLENPIAFSFFFGLLYCLIALLISLSDVPLSLNLVATGLNIPSQVTVAQVSGEWVRTVSDPLPSGALLVDASDILQHFLIVLKFLWEPWALALGIACCGLFFKLVLGKIEAFVRDRDQGRGQFFSTRVYRWILPVVYGLLLGAVGLTYWRLADLRGSVNQIKLFSDQTAAETEVGDSDRLKIVNAAQTELEQTSQALPGQSRSSFFWLTLTLPFVAGAFLAAGADCLSKRWKLTLLGRSTGALERKAQEWQDEAGRHTHESQYRREFVDTVMSSKEYRDQFVEARLAVYRHGYRRGLRVPETAHPSEKTYVWCERVLHRKLGIRLRRAAVPRRDAA